jgi:hypothetical protein
MILVCMRCQDQLTSDNAVANGFSKSGIMKYKTSCRECYNTQYKERREAKTKAIAEQLSAFQPMSIVESRPIKNLQVRYTFNMPPEVYSLLHRKELLNIYQDFIRSKLEVPSGYVVKCIADYTSNYLSHIVSDASLLEQLKTNLSPQINISFTHE